MCCIYLVSIIFFSFCHFFLWMQQLVTRTHSHWEGKANLFKINKEINNEPDIMHNQGIYIILYWCVQEYYYIIHTT